MYVSSETDVMYGLFDSGREHPVECMLVMWEDRPGEWEPLGFNAIKGFTYERGHEYELRVRRTILADPSAEGSNRAYSLVGILRDQLVAGTEIPVGQEIKSEEYIGYYDGCLIAKYAINNIFTVDGNGGIFDDDGLAMPSYAAARIHLENVLDKSDPDWRKFQSVPYQATYTFVLSPLTDKIRLVRNEYSGPMFKHVIPECEFAHVTRSMKSGEELRYALILSNVHKKGLQKVEFTVRRR